MNLKEQEKFWNDEKMDNRRIPEHPVIREYVGNKIKVIKRHIEASKGLSMLEVGAGNGFFSYYLEKNYELLATDYAKKMIELNPAHNKQVLDVVNINFEDNHFDIVFEANLLHHIDDIDEAISEMSRVSKKYVILIEPNRNNPMMFLFGAIKKVERASLKFSKTYLIKKIEKNNLKVASVFSHGIILPNKTPKFILPIMKHIDVKIPVVGFYNIFICEKNS